jgi:hypothetical protein
MYKALKLLEKWKPALIYGSIFSWVLSMVLFIVLATNCYKYVKTGVEPGRLVNLWLVAAIAKYLNVKDPSINNDQLVKKELATNSALAYWKEMPQLIYSSIYTLGCAPNGGFHTPLAFLSYLSSFIGYLRKIKFVFYWATRVNYCGNFGGGIQL